MRRLPYLNLHSRRRTLPQNHVHRHGIVRSILDLNSYPAPAQHLLRLRHFLPDHIWHHHFTALDRKTHRRNRAQERHRHQDERQQRNPENPFHAVAKFHDLDSRIASEASMSPNEDPAPLPSQFHTTNHKVAQPPLPPGFVPMLGGV